MNLPKKPSCAAWNCLALASDSGPFCSVHWKNIPMHLRVAFKSEIDWLREHKALPDQHTQLLLHILGNRELQMRMVADPKVKTDFEEWQKRQGVIQRAAQAGIVGANGQPIS